ncbi:MAG: hypothetical protein LBC82_01650 [Oscillospiraceae bacterium]|jgi:hypothetical protein|nr:hypothetical protein [Oscillospiraceae bacterium]
MKKITSVFLSIIVLISLCACSGTETPEDDVIYTEKAIEIDDIKSTDETPTTINDMIKSQYLRGFYQTFVNTELIDADFLTEEISLDIMHGKYGTHYTFHSIDESGNLYFYKSTDSLLSDETALIGYYNIFNKEVIIIKEAPDISIQYEISFVNEDFILWRESYDNSDWYKNRLCLYNRNTGEETVYFTPEAVYSRTMNPPCILDDYIYFEHTHYRDGEWFYVNLLKFNISDGTTSVVDTQSKKPVLYQDGVVYIKQSEDKEAQLLNFINKDGSINIIMELSNLNLSYISFSGDAVSFNYPLFEKDLSEETTGYGGMVGNGAGYLNENGEKVKVIESVEVARYIGFFDFHNNIGTLSFLEKMPPVYFDLINNTFYILKNTEPALYMPFVTDSFILYVFLNENDGKGQYRYLIMNMD